MSARDDAASTWTDLLVRNNTADTGQIPASGAVSSSPDLIPYGTQPVDPQTFLADMTVDYGRDVDVNEGNYVYARGVNLSKSAASGTVHLYWTKASLINWPQQWDQNEIPLNDKSFGSPVHADVAGDFVTDAPFFWTPSPVGDGDHYCLIGRVVTEADPNPLPSLLQIPDFAAWIAGNRGMSWRNVNLVTDPAAPTWQTSVGYDEGPTGEKVYMLLECIDLPVGSSVAFSCGTPGPSPTINLTPTIITSSSQVPGILTTIPANFSSQITYSYWANGTVMPPTAKITLKAIYVPGDGELPGLGRDIRELGVTDEVIHPDHLAQERVGPVMGIEIGSFGTHVAP